MLNRAAAFGHRFLGSANLTFFLKVASQIAFLLHSKMKPKSKNDKKKDYIAEPYPIIIEYCTAVHLHYVQNFDASF